MCVGEPGDRRLLLGVVDVEHLLRIFERLFNEDAFLSPYGLRAVSRWHLEHPYHLAVDGIDATIDYEPAESTTACSAATRTGAGRSGSRSTTSSSTRCAATPATSATT